MTDRQQRPDSIHRLSSLLSDLPFTSYRSLLYFGLVFVTFTRGYIGFRYFLVAPVSDMAVLSLFGGLHEKLHKRYNFVNLTVRVNPTKR